MSHSSHPGKQTRYGTNPVRHKPTLGATRGTPAHTPPRPVRRSWVSVVTGVYRVLKHAQHCGVGGQPIRLVTIRTTSAASALQRAPARNNDINIDIAIFVRYTVTGWFRAVLGNRITRFLPGAYVSIAC